MAQFTFVPSRLLPQKRPVRKIGVVIYPLAEVLDITGPLEVFSFANAAMQRGGFCTEPIYPLETYAEQPGPIRTLSGIEIVASRSYHDTDDDIDTLFIPGGDVTSETAPNSYRSILTNDRLLAWINAMAPKVRRLASVCSGAFILAQCGLLDDCRATTNFYDTDRHCHEHQTMLKNLQSMKRVINAQNWPPQALEVFMKSWSEHIIHADMELKTLNEDRILKAV